MIENVWKLTKIEPSCWNKYITSARYDNIVFSPIFPTPLGQTMPSYGAYNAKVICSGEHRSHLPEPRELDTLDAKMNTLFEELLRAVGCGCVRPTHKPLSKYTAYFVQLS